MFRTSALALAGIFGCATLSQAATQIDVGDHLLLPNSPNQKIEIFVTGGDQIEGMNFNAQIGTDPEHAVGIPVFQYEIGTHFSYPGPNLSTLLASGSVFAPPAGEYETDVTFFDTLWQSGALTPSGTVGASGLLATLYIDTTGVVALQGTSWPLILSNTLGGPTNWAGSIFNGQEVPNPIIIDGSITIVPEPSSIALAAFAAVGFCAVAVRRRMNRS